MQGCSTKQLFISVLEQDANRIGITNKTKTKVTTLQISQHTWDSLCYIVFILPSVELPRLQCAEPVWPPTLVSILHQLGNDGWGATAVNQSSFDHCLKHRVWRRDHASPSGDPCCLQAAHPSVNNFVLLKFPKERFLISNMTVQKHTATTALTFNGYL